MNDAGSPLRKTVIVTGASRGIGHVTAKTFLDRGWRIITCSRDAAPAECRRDPNWTCHIPTDLADGESLDRFAMHGVLGGDHHRVCETRPPGHLTPVTEDTGGVDVVFGGHALAILSARFGHPHDLGPVRVRRSKFGIGGASRTRSGDDKCYWIHVRQYIEEDPGGGRWCSSNGLKLRRQGPRFAVVGV